MFPNLAYAFKDYGYSHIVCDLPPSNVHYFSLMTALRVVGRPVEIASSPRGSFHLKFSTVHHFLAHTSFFPSIYTVTSINFSITVYVLVNTPREPSRVFPTFLARAARDD